MFEIVQCLLSTSNRKLFLKNIYLKNILSHFEFWILIGGNWLWIHKTEWPAILFFTANKGQSTLSTNKTDDGYRKIFCNRKNLALFILSLKLSSVSCRLQIENCFWRTFNSKTYFLFLYFEYYLEATDFGYIKQNDQPSYSPQLTKARLYCPQTKLMMVTAKYLLPERIWLYFI